MSETDSLVALVLLERIVALRIDKNRSGDIKYKEFINYLIDNNEVDN